MSFLLCAVQGFLLGSVPWGLLIGRAARGVDIRTRGSGNLGATNAFRVLGARLGLLVLALDMAKGWGAVVVGGWMAVSGAAALPLVGGVAAVAGHVASPWVRFRGGKGVATAAGAFLGLAPLATLVALAVWIALFALTRYVSLASMVAAIVLPLALWFGPGSGETTAPVRAVAVAVAALILVRHRGNIRRLAGGNENRIVLRRAHREDAAGKGD